MSTLQKGSKPLLRGHSHQAAFFVALGACLVLLNQTKSPRAFVSLIVYTLGLAGLFGISALYHRPHWEAIPRSWMRRLDHAAIYLLIAGTVTPICLLGFRADEGFVLLKTVWAAASIGILQSLFWVKAPKWLNAILYVAVGWIAVPFFPELLRVLGHSGVGLIAAGGVAYTLGAAVYALRRPDPWPRVFGYHEIFHALVVVGAFLHFLVVYRLLSLP